MRFLLTLVLATLLSSCSGQFTIDGDSATIGTVAAQFWAGNIEESFTELVNNISLVLSPSQPEEDIDYFALIKDKVTTVVGTYLNEHNMDQLESYKDSLAYLLQRYSAAPVESDTYPTKNVMANDLSTVITSNRFLIEAMVYPHSMVLHFGDIAAIHVLVLEDVANAYTYEGEVPSYWWVDLDNELEHYINYGIYLEDTFTDWRNDLVECSFTSCDGYKQEDSSPRICYNDWTVTDHVTGLSDTCRAIQGDTSCDDHCQAYQIAMNRSVNQFLFYYLDRLINQWSELKMLSSHMAAIVIGSGKNQEYTPKRKLQVTS